MKAAFSTNPTSEPGFRVALPDNAAISLASTVAPGDPIPLSALRTGDEAAWSEAFQRLWPVAIRAARNPALRLTSGEAEDAAMEALTQLVPQVDKVATGEELAALAAAMAFRRAVSQARRNSAAKRGPAPLSLSEFPSGDAALPAMHSLDGERLSDLERAEMAVLLRRALAGVDPVTRRLLEGVVMEGRSHKETSASSGMPMGTVGSKVMRGLAAIRQQLEKSPALMKELKSFLR